MKHAIAILEAEDDRLTSELTRLAKQGKPSNYRVSEWAMQLGSLKTKRLETFEAIQALKKIVKERSL